MVHLHATESTCYTTRLALLCQAHSAESDLILEQLSVLAYTFWFEHKTLVHKTPAPQICCCHLVPLCWKASVPFRARVLKGCLRDPPLGISPSELVMRSSLKICLQTPWKQECGCSVTSPGPKTRDIGLLHRCGSANTLRTTQTG